MLKVPERLVGVACALTSVVLFSSFTLVSRLGLSSALRLPDIAALRFGIGGTLLLPVLLRHGLRGIRLRGAVALALFGGLGFASFAYAGFSLAPAAHGAVLLHGTLPLFTLLVLKLTSAEPTATGPNRAVGVALIVTGVTLLAYDSLAVASTRQLLGDACLLLASLSWSVYGVLARRSGLPPARTAAIVAGLSMCCCLPAYALWPGKTLFLVSGRVLVLQAVVQGVLIGAVSVFIYTRAVAALGAAETSLFTAAVPCITTIVAIPLLSELPTPLTWLGVIVVTLGMLVAMSRTRGFWSWRRAQ